MFKKVSFAILVVTFLCGGALGYEGQDMIGEYAIFAGIPTIDGVISPGEWDKANWLELDKEYWGTASDLSDANWAALWSPETDLIYVVIRGIDTDHIFGDGYTGSDDWNKYDIAEVYIDAPNSDVQLYQHLQDPAQQWMSGNDNNDGRWIMIPVEWVYPENPLDDSLRPEFMSTVTDDLYVYEYAIKPYESFGWNTGSETKILALEDDMVVGLDVIMSSKSGGFGMLCENAWAADDDLDGDGEADGVITVTKWNYANRLLDHCLVSDPNKAWRPRPGNKSIDAASTVTLKWNAGKEAAWHHIYFGSDFDDVNDATDPNAAPIGKGRQARADNTNTPNDCPLELGQTYYWRIDEVNGASYCKGNTWRFRVVNYHVFEDFDSYTDTGELRLVWKDGWTNLTGSEGTIETDPNYLRSGQSLKFDYDNDWYEYGYYSEIEAEMSKFEVGSDLTVDGVKSIVLWFHGDLDNSVEQMYLALEDLDDDIVDLVYDGDANDMKYPYWKEWNIDSREFTDGGIDLTNVKKIYIGFGDRNDPEAGGVGTIWFDDIRLYKSRCVPAYAKADFTGDCITDLADLEIMAGDWLESDFVVDVTEPVSNLVLWYEFDETSGFDAIDSSGNGYDGDVIDCDWTDGHIDGALNFNQTTSEVSVPAEAFSSVTTEITIALWQYGDEYRQPQDDNLFEGTKDYYNNEIRILNAHLPWSNEIVYWDAGNPNDVYDPNVYRDCDRIEKEAEDFSEYAGQWNHWTFVKDCDANGGSGVMKMYLNGFLWHIGYGEPEPNGLNEPMTGDIENFTIGKGFDGSYAGMIDDFRVYDRELSQEEISWLATEGTGYYLLQSREANVYEDEKIDFKDFAGMADYWLEEVLFPSP